jgi:hypothetical protein
LYLYMQEVLLAAHVEQSDAKLSEVLNLLSTLAEGWRQVARLEASGALSQPAGAEETPVPALAGSFAPTPAFAGAF